MPHLVPDEIKHRIALNFPGRDGIRQLAELANIPLGGLRGVAGGRDYIHLSRIYQIAPHLKRNEAESTEDVVRALIRSDSDPDDPVTTPPDQPTQPAKKQGREETAGTGPKRAQRNKAESGAA